jgi:hypothetical protein
MARTFDAASCAQYTSLEQARHDLRAALEADPLMAQLADGFDVRLQPKTMYCVYKKLMREGASLRDWQSVMQLQVRSWTSHEACCTATDIYLSLKSTRD